MLEETDTRRHRKLTREELHRTYAGEISSYDFDGYTSLTEMASKIVNSESFMFTLERVYYAKKRQEEHEANKEWL